MNTKSFECSDQIKPQLTNTNFCSNAGNVYPIINTDGENLWKALCLRMLVVRPVLPSFA